MPYTLTLYRSRGFYRAKFEGVVTGTELMEFARHHSLDKDLSACRRVLMDLSETNYEGSSLGQLEAIVDMVERFLRRRRVTGLRTAVLVTQAFQVGLSNQYRLIAESRGIRPEIYDFRPFTDAGEALAWLSEAEPS